VAILCSDFRWGLVKRSVQYRRRGPYEEETCVFIAGVFGMELYFFGGGEGGGESVGFGWGKVSSGGFGGGGVEGYGFHCLVGWYGDLLVLFWGWMGCDVICLW